MTHSATKFISPLSFQALSGNPVATELLDADEENAMGHITLARWADILIIAPATANSLAKFSYGLADDLLSTLVLAADCPLFIAPAMNQAMWGKDITQQNILRLKKQNIHIIGPESGSQACGETGEGRMSEAVDICNALTCSDLPLAGINVLISAGPTQEPIDPVRYISNRSSGKMGYALAEAALNLGAKVTLISGPVAINCPPTLSPIYIKTAQQMHQAVISRASDNDIYIGAAAVADYSPITTSQQKIKKYEKDTLIKLQKTRDILADVANSPHRPRFVVGFAAETEQLEHYAKEKLTRKNLDMIAANWVGKEQGGFESDENALHVYWKNGSQALPMTTKKHLANQLIDLIIEIMNEKNTTKNTR